MGIWPQACAPGVGDGHGLSRRGREEGERHAALAVADEKGARGYGRAQFFNVGRGARYVGGESYHDRLRLGAHPRSYCRNIYLAAGIERGELNMHPPVLEVLQRTENGVMLSKCSYHLVARAQSTEKSYIQSFGTVFCEYGSVARPAAEKFHELPAAGVHALGTGDGEFVTAAPRVGAYLYCRTHGGEHILRLETARGGIIEIDHLANTPLNFIL